MGRLWDLFRGVESRAEAPDDPTPYGLGLGRIPTLAGWGGPAIATGKSAGVEVASGFLSRAFIAANIDGPEPVLRMLDGRLRALIGRGLVVDGQVLLVLDVTADGRMVLQPATGSVFGRPDPATWSYWATPAGPSSPGEWRRYSRLEVAHLMYEPHPSRPWQGVTPADGIDARLAALVSSALSREAAAPHGNVMSIRPSRADRAGNVTWGEAQTTETRRRMPQALGELSRGGLAVLVSSEVEAGQGPSSQGSVARVGFAPPGPVAQLYQMSFDATVSSFGLPPNLTTQTGYSRDALRQYELTVARPLIEATLEELGRVLEADLSLSRSTTRTPADYVSLARSAASLRQAGLDIGEIRDLLGI